jgi:hypothetical protein
MDSCLMYNQEFKLTICQVCHVGLPSGNILRHIRMHHRETWRVHKEALQKHVKTLDLASLQGLADAQPDGVREPIHGINIVAGWCCDEEGCQVASISEQYLRKHAQKVHGWTAYTEKMWFESRLQTLLGNPYIKY